MTQFAVAAIGVLGGIAVALIGDHYRRKWDRDEQARKLISQYRDPLLRAAFDLQSRLYNIVVLRFLSYVQSPDETKKAYALDTTLWHFANFLGWVEVLRHEVQFLDLGTARKNKELQSRLGEVAQAFASDRAEFRPRKVPPVDAGESRQAQRGVPREQAMEPGFILFRADQQAVGQAMFKERAEDDSTRLECLTYSDFATLVASQKDESPTPLDRWYRRFRCDLEELAGGGWSTQHPRLIAIQRSLIELIDLLDPDQERFPDRNTRGKIPSLVTTDPHPFRLAHFVWPDDRRGDDWRANPWSRVEEWASHFHAAEISSSDDPPLRAFRWTPRSGFGASLEVCVTYQDRWLTIDGWTRMPGTARRLAPVLLAGIPYEPGSGGAKPRLPLEGNSLFFATSQRRARYVANQLLEQFDRPKVLPEPFPRRQFFIAATPLIALAGVAAALAVGQGDSGPSSNAAVTTGTSGGSPSSSQATTSTVPDTTAERTTATNSTPLPPVTVTVTETAAPVTVTESAPDATTPEQGGKQPPATTPVPVARIALPPCTRGETAGQCRDRRRNVALWRTLRGSVAGSPSAPRVRGVEVSIVRIAGDRCAAYTGFGFSGAFCAQAFGVWLPATFSAGHWEMTVRQLASGRYVLRVRAIDAAGRQQRPPAKLLLTLAASAS